MTWDGRALWLSDQSDVIYQIDPETGTVIRSFAAPDALVNDLAWDGHSLWATDQGANRIHQINPVSGTVIKSFGAPNQTPRGLTWDGRTLWVSDGGNDSINQLSVTPGASYADRVIATGPIGYWDQGEAAGTISFDISGHSPLSERDGAYTGVTLAQAGIGDGRTSGLYDGANDFDDIFTAIFAAAFNGGEGSILVWGQASGVGVWADGVQRYLVRIRADGNNVVWIQKLAAANTLAYRYTAGGVAEAVNHVTVTPNWFSVLLTWSASAGATGEVIAYFDGAQTGATQVALGVWAGLPANNFVVIGASNTVPASVWDGTLAHGVVWDYALSPAQALSVGVL